MKDNFFLLFYKEPKNSSDWSGCPECNFTPRVWEFDNGRYARCACGKNSYEAKHEVSAISIVDYIKQNDGSTEGYHSDDLRQNWNNYIKLLKQNHEDN